MLKAQPALAECALSKFIRAFRLFKSKQGSSLEQLNLWTLGVCGCVSYPFSLRRCPSIPPRPSGFPLCPQVPARRNCHGSPAGKVADGKRHLWNPKLPVLDPRVWLVGFLGVVFWEEAPAAGAVRGADDPALAHVTLLRGVHVDQVPSVDHELINVLGLVLEEGPQPLGGHTAGSGCSLCCSSSGGGCSPLLDAEPVLFSTLQPAL